jgi:hypothetical protein
MTSIKYLLTHRLHVSRASPSPFMLLVLLKYVVRRIKSRLATRRPKERGLGLSCGRILLCEGKTRGRSPDQCGQAVDRPRTDWVAYPRTPGLGDIEWLGTDLAESIIGSNETDDTLQLGETLQDDCHQVEDNVQYLQVVVHQGREASKYLGRGCSARPV